MELETVVVGLGYVGLPLALAAAKCDFTVLGCDINSNKIESINSGRSDISDISDYELLEAMNQKRFSVTDKLTKSNNNRIFVICVPTPLTNNQMPDMTLVEVAIENVAKVMSSGDMIILESTVAPGACRSLVLPLIQEISGLSISDFDFAFSPERIDPKNKIWTIKNTPKIVAGLNPKSKIRAINFYSNFVDKVIECKSIEVAELAKLLENSFRLINISFINEISIFSHKMGLDINEVIEAASTKPYGFMPFYPSIGVGGHCIPVDPVYLADKARTLGSPTRLIELASIINNEMPAYFVNRIENQLGDLNGRQILVIGVAYKPNIADVRETPVEALIALLMKKGAKVFWHDDLVKEWKGVKSVELNSDYDLAIIATQHDYLDLTKLGNTPMINTKSSL